MRPSYLNIGLGALVVILGGLLLWERQKGAQLPAPPPGPAGEHQPLPVGGTNAIAQQALSDGGPRKPQVPVASGGPRRVVVNFGWAPEVQQGCMKAVAEAALAALEEPESEPARLGSVEGCSDSAAQGSLRLSLLATGEEVSCTATRSLEQEGVRPRQEGKASAGSAREACAAALASLPPL